MKSAKKFMNFCLLNP